MFSNGVTFIKYFIDSIMLMTLVKIKADLRYTEIYSIEKSWQTSLLEKRMRITLDP